MRELPSSHDRVTTRLTTVSPADADPAQAPSTDVTGSGDGHHIDCGRAALYIVFI